MTERKVRSDKKYKFTKDELSEQIRAALIWSCDGLSWHVMGREDESQPLVMGDPDNLTIIIVEALTKGLPDSEDSAASAATTS